MILKFAFSQFLLNFEMVDYKIVGNLELKNWDNANFKNNSFSPWFCIMFLYVSYMSDETFGRCNIFMPLKH